MKITTRSRRPTCGIVWQRDKIELFTRGEVEAKSIVWRRGTLRSATKRTTTSRAVRMWMPIGHHRNKQCKKLDMYISSMLWNYFKRPASYTTLDTHVNSFSNSEWNHRPNLDPFPGMIECMTTRLDSSFTLHEVHAPCATSDNPCNLL